MRSPSQSLTDGAPPSPWARAGRVSLVVAALLCAGTMASAQVGGGGLGGWEAGVKSGVSRAGLTAAGEFEWRYAPTSAAFFKRGITRFLSIQPELMYLRRTGVSSIAGSTLTMTADNVELPVMLNLHVPGAFGIAPYLSAGPSFAFRVRCRLQFLGGGLSTNDDCEGGGGGTQSRRLDLGVAGGGGLAWTVGAMTVVMESRLATGLRTNVLPVDVGDARTLSWSVLAGVSMPLTRRTLPPVRRPPFVASRPADIATPIRPAVPLAAPAPIAPPLAPARRHITITADDVEVRDVIEEIARVTGYNVIVGTQVHRRVTAALFDVPADAAVRHIADVTGLLVLPPSTPGGAAIVMQNKVPSSSRAVRRP